MHTSNNSHKLEWLSSNSEASNTGGILSPPHPIIYPGSYSNVNLTQLDICTINLFSHSVTLLVGPHDLSYNSPPNIWSKGLAYVDHAAGVTDPKTHEGIERE